VERSRRFILARQASAQWLEKMNWSQGRGRNDLKAVALFVTTPIRNTGR
jgi:hypothetical protein